MDVTPNPGKRGSHGQTRGGYTPTYNIWTQLMSRCYNPRHVSFKDYGARGITVALRWQDYAIFHAEMGDRPDGMSIERLDNNKGYEPGNCIWATRAQQARNKRNTRYVEFRGRKMLLMDAVAISGIPSSTVYHRIRRGWSIHDALNTPARKKS